MNYRVLRRKLRDYFNKHKELMQLWVLRQLSEDMIIEHCIDKELLHDYYMEDNREYYDDRD